MKLQKKNISILGIAGCIMAILLTMRYYEVYKMQQKFLKEGQKTQAYVGIKSQKWEETEELYWEVSYWLIDKKYKFGKLVRTKIKVSRDVYDQYEEDEEVEVYYLKKNPQKAKLSVQIHEPLLYHWIIVWGGAGLILLLRNSRIL